MSCVPFSFPYLNHRLQQNGTIGALLLEIRYHEPAEAG